jgi:hypothetical protein
MRMMTFYSAVHGVAIVVGSAILMLNGYWHPAHANDVPTVGGQLAYKASELRRAQGIFRLEHRYDYSTGPQGGFFTDVR